MTKTTSASSGRGPKRRIGGKPNKVKCAPPFDLPPPSDDCGAEQSTSVNNNGKTASSASSSASASASASADALISELRDHVDQGRIFDARSVARELLGGIEGVFQATSSSPHLEPDVRHLIEEVATQSEHVESLLRQLHSDDDWTLAKQRSGVTVHYRREPNSNIHVVRASTTFENFSPRDFVRLTSLFVETEYMHRWFPGGIMSPASVLSWHTKYSKVIQLHINVALPMISSRDAIVLGSGYHLPDRNAFLISTRTLLEDTCRHCDVPRPKGGVVRMATDSIFYIQLIRSDAISFKIISRDDLKLKYVPTSLLNYLSQGHMPFEIMKTIHRTIRNFGGTVWEDKIRERGAYYTEIEDKVHDQLERWEKEEGIDEDNLDSSKGGAQSPQSTRRKSMPTTDQCTENEVLDRVFVSDENERKVSRQNFITTVIIASVWLLLSTLHFVPMPEMFQNLAPAPLLAEVLGTENTRLTIMIITSCIVPFVTIIISSISRVKRRRHQADRVACRQQSSNSVDNNDETDDSGIGDGGCNEFLPILNIDSEAVSKKVSTGQLKMEDSNHIRTVSDITLTPHSQVADGMEIRPTPRSFPPPLPKLVKVRSTLGAVLRGLKRKKNAGN
jgi:hypothetical protein